MKKSLLSIFLVACALACGATGKPKYVFLFIGDGLSSPQRTLAEEFSRRTGRGPLAINTMPYQAVTRTCSASSLVTDSAAAATALACGVKTINGWLGLDPQTQRVESVAQVARAAGLKVGIVTTVPIVHATPAGFYAHNTSRQAAYEIGLDLIASGFDYFAGSGVYTVFDDRRNPHYRGNLFTLAQEAGYVVTRDDCAAWRRLKPGVKSWSTFGTKGMDFAIDATGNQPTLAEIVAKGIELLENPRGFFLMCEGGKIDYACHANDGATALRETLAFDAAVRVALAFGEKHPRETLVVTTGDHETGGLTLPKAAKGSTADLLFLAKQKVSGEKFSADIRRLIQDRHGEVSFDDIKVRLQDLFGLQSLSASEETCLRTAWRQDVKAVMAQVKDTTAHDVPRRYALAKVLKQIVSDRAGLHWTLGDHTALPTVTTATGAGAEILVGMTDNTEIAQRLKKLIQTEL